MMHAYARPLVRFVLVLALRFHADALQTSRPAEALLAENRFSRSVRQPSDGCIPIPGNMKPSWFNISNDIEVCHGEVRLIPKVGEHVLKASSTAKVTKVFFLALAGLVLAFVIGMFWDRSLGPSADKARVMRSIVLLIVACYALMGPGVSYPVISINLKLHIPLPEDMRMPFVTGVSMPCFPSPSGMLIESMVSVISTLFKAGSWVAGVLVFFYGMAVPAIKLVIFVAIFVIVEISKADKSERLAQRLDSCVSWVRFISKWDAPKLFAYLTMKLVFDELNSPPHVTSAALLDIGFALYSLFSVGSLLACVIHYDFTAKHPRSSKQLALTSSGKPWSTWGLVLAVAFAATVFLLLFATGATLPMMSLKYVPLYKIYGPLSPTIQSMGLEQEATLSLFGCLVRAFGGLSMSNSNALMVVVLLFGFVVCLPTLSMLAYLVAALSRLFKSKNAERCLTSAIWWMNVFDYLGMLDVMLVGVVIMRATTVGALAQAGTTMALQTGFWWLCAAQAWFWLWQWLLNRDGIFSVESPACSESAEAPLAKVLS
mmetsp:Transcript_52826/g.113140  ORF Transcript_52826/g.113140 Transcript_52826/m.113140 type:complete len:543 (-) Transcript_52826:36-1664(-)